MTRPRHLRGLAAIGPLAIAGACALHGGQVATVSIDLGPAIELRTGVELFHLADPQLLDPPGPISVHLLRIDTRQVRLESALALDQVMGLEPVRTTAGRHGAIAAVNAGFFRPSGDPDGVLKVEGELVSDRDPDRPRGAVAILDDDDTGRQLLLFDQLAVSAMVSFEAEGGRHTFPIAGIDTTRLRQHLMLFTPRYHEDTDTAPSGTEWVLDGRPLRVQSVRPGAGKTPIPPRGAVLSFGGTELPSPLELLTVGRTVDIRPRYEAVFGTPQATWEGARQIIGGAGLLLRDGQALRDWTVERFREGFTTERHPRTLIGVDPDGAVWLAAVDGRQPGSSVGMTFAELQGLARRLGLRSALNLDGGGSTTMVVGGRVVNRPSDAAGPRPVSDALLIIER